MTQRKEDATEPPIAKGTRRRSSAEATSLRTRASSFIEGIAVNFAGQLSAENHAGHHEEQLPLAGFRVTLAQALLGGVPYGIRIIERVRRNFSEGDIRRCISIKTFQASGDVSRGRMTS
jgi:hypothetical protein